MGKFFATIIMLIAATFFIIGCEKSPTQPEPFQSDSDWVDLGLPSGLLWATHNVGATSPEDYGDYFAWGETLPKSVYTWETYRYFNGVAPSGWPSRVLTKYCTRADYGYNGYTDGLTTLQPGDDAATANWGDDARTPTYEEWRELLTHTRVQLTTVNGVNGLCLTGPNGNNLFLPTAGYYNSYRGNSLLRADRGFYWSSSLSNVPYVAGTSYIQGENLIMDHCDRFCGVPVRAVRSAH